MGGGRARWRKRRKGAPHFSSSSSSVPFTSSVVARGESESEDGREGGKRKGGRGRRPFAQGREGAKEEEEDVERRRRRTREAVAWGDLSWEEGRKEEEESREKVDRASDRRSSVRPPVDVTASE